ncbi:CGNR zinc finger domain-containing protein [Sphingomonas sp. PR090111-T3T-6A]|uniref:CGNR zinc finger domain-containing protein n=1 Tax=Sphingomonas sp. PR090111-T3T-6A TaxID=685778 RepID=UPI00036232CD|nr:ABATE domain-containing protein [Sphingomonas sp. PR090111-T3T-6A]
MAANMPAFFIADARGIDFLNSIATPAEEAVDWLRDGAGLVDWLRQAGLVPDRQLDELTERAMPGELDRVADQARDLREWFRGFVKSHMGQPLPADAIADLAPLNRLLERDEAYDRIVSHERGRLTLETARRWRSPESLLIPIGEALARAVVEEDFTHVKACQGQSCTLLFADHTRGHARRWCSMSVCGNRAKVAAHRSRQKESGARHRA